MNWKQFLLAKTSNLDTWSGKLYPTKFDKFDKLSTTKGNSVKLEIVVTGGKAVLFSFESNRKVQVFQQLWTTHINDMVNILEIAGLSSTSTFQVLTNQSFKKVTNLGCKNFMVPKLDQMAACTTAKKFKQLRRGENKEPLTSFN